MENKDNFTKAVAIISIHYGINYGSTLQSYALYHYLTNKNYDCKVINYIPPRYSLWNWYSSSRKNRFPIFVMICYFPIYILKVLPGRMRFYFFQRKHITFTRKYKCYDKLEKDPPIADIYIAGSDQIWNDDYNGITEKAYCLSFVPDGKIKISYAGSFGKGFPLSDSEVYKFKKELSSFHRHSVRESDAVRIMEQLGLQAEHVCDPTILLSSNEWNSISSRTHFCEKYIFVYVMDGIYQGLLNNAKIVADTIGAKIYVLSFSHIDDKRIDRQFISIGPELFLSLVRDAECIITNSFHGTVFSIIFRKQLLVLGKNKYNSRPKSLLQKVGLQNRFIEKDDIIKQEDVNALMLPIYTSEVEERLDKWIAQSEKYIHDAMQ